jgi:hypothetical protein
LVEAKALKQAHSRLRNCCCNEEDEYKDKLVVEVISCMFLTNLNPARLTMEFKNYLKTLVENDGSDLYLTVAAPPTAKFDGILKPLEQQKLTKERIKEIAYSLMDNEQQAQFEQVPEMNLAISETGIGRFRINVFRQRNNLRKENIYICVFR